MNTTQDRTLVHIGLTREQVMQLTAHWKSAAGEAEQSCFKSDKCVFPAAVKAEIRQLKAVGCNYQEIAEEVGCSKTSVYNVLNEQ